MISPKRITSNESYNDLIHLWKRPFNIRNFGTVYVKRVNDRSEKLRQVEVDCIYRQTANDMTEIPTHLSGL